MFFLYLINGPYYSRWALYKSHARVQNVLSEGVQLWQRFFFLFSSFLLFLSRWREGGSKYHYKRAIIGLPAKRHLNGVSLACRWWPNIKCWLGSFKIFRGSGPVLLRNPIYFLIFQGGPDPCPPLLWIRAWIITTFVIILSWETTDIRRNDKYFVTKEMLITVCHHKTEQFP